MNSGNGWDEEEEFKNEPQPAETYPVEVEAEPEPDGVAINGTLVGANMSVKSVDFKFGGADAILDKRSIVVDRAILPEINAETEIYTGEFTFRIFVTKK